MGRLALAASLAVLVAAGLASAGSYTPPPGDCCPQWSPNGTQLVFTTGRPADKTVVAAVSSSGGAEQLVPGIPVGARSPDWKHVAYVKSGSLAVANVDGSNEKLLGQSSDFAWSPDSSKLAFSGTGGALFVVHADGTGLQKIAPGPGIGMPSWSPNGARIAYVKPADNGHIHVVDTNGSGDAKLAGPAGGIEPMWAPDSKRLSFLYANRIVVVRLGGPSRTFLLPQPAVFNNGWFPDGKALLYVVEPVLPAGVAFAEAGSLVNGRPFEDELVRLDVASGGRRVLSFGDGAAFSNDGRWMALSSGGECRDRSGVYVMRANGTQRRRLTNDCTIRGTAGADTLHGTDLADVELGLGGNDHLVASDPGYVGDTAGRRARERHARRRLPAGHALRRARRRHALRRCLGRCARRRAGARPAEGSGRRGHDLRGRRPARHRQLRYGPRRGLRRQARRSQLRLRGRAPELSPARRRGASRPGTSLPRS